MSELGILIEQITNDISVSNKKYVYFNKDTGVIDTITPRLLDNRESFIEVETEEIIDILTGKRSLGDYVVSFDINFKKFVIKDKSAFDEYLKRDSYLYEIPKYSNDSIVFKREFLGIHVDVWYQELEHVKGQHVWYENSVYMMIKDVPANTKFQKKYTKLIVSNVKLYNDGNIYLDFDRNLKRKDLILNCNKIFSIHFDSTTVVEKSEIDCYVIQDNTNNFWSFSLGEICKKELKPKKENLDNILIFSITSKEDPNLLYRYFQINLKDLFYKNAITFEFQFDFEFENEEVSIYTSKHFRTYLHEVI